MTTEKTCKRCRAKLSWWQRIVSDYCRPCLLEGIK